MKKILLASCVAVGLSLSAHAGFLTDEATSVAGVFARLSTLPKSVAVEDGARASIGLDYSNLRNRTRSPQFAKSCNEVVFLAALLSSATNGFKSALDLYSVIIDDYRAGARGVDSVLFKLLGSKWGAAATGIDARVYASGDALKSAPNVATRLTVGSPHAQMAHFWMNEFFGNPAVKMAQPVLAGTSDWDKHFAAALNPKKAITSVVLPQPPKPVVAQNPNQWTSDQRTQWHQLTLDFINADVATYSLIKEDITGFVDKIPAAAAIAFAREMFGLSKMPEKTKPQQQAKFEALMKVIYQQPKGSEQERVLIKAVVFNICDGAELDYATRGSKLEAKVKGIKNAAPNETLFLQSLKSAMMTGTLFA